MRRALIAVEEPLEATRLAVSTAILAGAGAEACMVHVSQARSDDREISAALDEGVEQLRARGLTATALACSPAHGSVAAELAWQARRLRSDLLVVGSADLGCRPAPAPDSVCHEVLSLTRTAVLVVPSFAFVPVRGVRRALAMVGADEDRERVAAQLLELCQRPEVLVFYTCSVPVAVAGPGPRQFPAAVSDEAVDEMLDRLRRGGLRSLSLCLPSADRSAWTIASVADTWAADLLVVGPRRLDEIGSLIFPETSSLLSRRLDLPVLVARVPGPAPEEA